jgi:hypothetical protein
MKTAKQAILAKLAPLNGMTQTTDVDERGAVRATLVVGSDRARIDLDWVAANGGEEKMPDDVYDDLASHSDTDEIEDAVRETFAAADVDSVDVVVNWSPLHGDVDVSVNVRTTPRNGDGGGIHMTASTEQDGLDWRDCGAAAEVSAVVIDEARKGEDVTGYDDLAAGDPIEDDARAALCRLGDAIGY